MRIRQRVEFAVLSETLDAETITARLGIEPDAVGVRGSRRADPPRPAQHAWEVRCDARGLSIDEQVALVFARIRPVESQLAALRSEPDCQLRLEFVRYFDDADGEPEELSAPEESLQKLTGQHQLLGWVLDAESIEFLARINASIWADEYG